MTALNRSNTLFVSEQWIRIYEALQFVDFRAYDFDNLVNALVGYIQNNYPDSFNDYIASSEFVMKVEILAWLSQNIAFRVDLNTRENFLATAERRDSLLKLAYMIAYKVNRAVPASGDVRIDSITTTQVITDSDNNNLAGKEIFWNSPSNYNWFEQFILVMNAAFQARCPYGKPVNAFSDSSGNKVQQYRLNSNAPSTGVYPFSANVNGDSLPFEIYNADLSSTDGSYAELPPDPRNTYSLFYRTDGNGYGSAGTGFFLPLTQGSLTYTDTQFNVPQILQSFIINTQNVSNDDFFVQQIDGSGNVVTNWTKVDAAFGTSTAFSTLSSDISNIFEIDTLSNDRVVVRFGDGKLGAIPTGNFRFWYRTVNGSPVAVKPSSITQKIVTLPYVSNGAIYYLTIKYSLQTELVNASASESNQSIRTRANKVFYTQNRMVTGEDLNSFFLKDPSIQKVKTVNRTFAGHSRFSKLSDPTGLYSNVKVIGTDGRLYQAPTQVVNFYAADPTVLAPIDLVNTYIKPILQQEDKQILYFNSYNEIYFPASTTWHQTSIVGPHSRGNVKVNGSIVPVGVSATTGTPAYYVQPDSVVRFGSLKGDVIGVTRIVGDGTASDGVIFVSTLPDASALISVMPALRTVFTLSEQIAVLQNIIQKLDFGISWNQSTLSYQIISYQNINTTADFSILNQGDSTQTNLDASWLIRFHYIPGGNQPDQWEVIDRGLSYFVESARDIGFYFSNTADLVDPDTGTVVFDHIDILAQNESRDSLRRRALDTFVTGSCSVAAVKYIGDGTTTQFNTSETPMDPTKTVVEVNSILQVYGIDWTVTQNPSGDRVTFFTAPPLNADIEIQIATNYVYGQMVCNSFVGNGSTNSYLLSGVTRLATANTFVFNNGTFTNPGQDYTITSNANQATIQYTSPLGNGVESVVYAISGINSFAFVKSVFFGNGTTVSYPLSALQQSQDSVFVVLNGQPQYNHNYTISNLNSSTDQITFNTPPGNGIKIILTASDIPAFTRTKNYAYTGDGSTTGYALTGMRNLTSSQIIVSMNGSFRDGPNGVTPTYTVQNGNTVQFISPPGSGAHILIFVIEAAIGTITTPLAVPTQIDTTSNTDVSSCLVSFMGENQTFRVYDTLKDLDGYTNPTGLAVSPADTLQAGTYDNPFQFKDLVLQDGFTDLVLWQKTTIYGATRWLPINANTVSPAGTYSLSAFGGPTVGSAIAPALDQDVHYDVTENQWLVANGTTGLWGLAADQSVYRVQIGRDNLAFMWTHYASDDHRIDPSPTNIHNTFILSSTYYAAYQAWIVNNGALADEPVPPTPETLALQFSDFDQYKMLSDSIVYYPARFKPLFGTRADASVQGTFMVIKSPGSSVSDNDLKINILNAIDTYFSPDNFDFGETFYLTELITYITTTLSPDVLSIVVVPKNNNQVFGRLFQIRSESDELFINVATVDDITLVDQFSDAQLRIGSF